LISERKKTKLILIKTKLIFIKIIIIYTLKESGIFLSDFFAIKKTQNPRLTCERALLVINMTHCPALGNDALSGGVKV